MYKIYAALDEIRGGKYKIYVVLDVIRNLIDQYGLSSPN